MFSFRSGWFDLKREVIKFHKISERIDLKQKEINNIFRVVRIWIRIRGFVFILPKNCEGALRVCSEINFCEKSHCYEACIAAGRADENFQYWITPVIGIHSQSWRRFVLSGYFPVCRCYHTTIIKRLISTDLTMRWNLLLTDRRRYKGQGRRRWVWRAGLEHLAVGRSRTGCPDIHLGRWATWANRAVAGRRRPSVRRSLAPPVFRRCTLLKNTQRQRRLSLSTNGANFRGSFSKVQYTLFFQNKVPTFKLTVTLSNLNRFSKFLHC